MILKTIFKSTRIWFYLYKQYNRKHSLSINIINYNYKMYKIIIKKNKNILKDKRLVELIKEKSYYLEV